MNSIKIQGHDVHGVQVNSQTGCLHYNSSLDLVAIKFKCCGNYYACYSCHLALNTHPIQRWQHEDLNEKAILCGHCGTEMTIHQYVVSKSTCLNCHSPFNPKCQLHWNLYFEESCLKNRGTFKRPCSKIIPNLMIPCSKIGGIFIYTLKSIAYIFKAFLSNVSIRG